MASERWGWVGWVVVLVSGALCVFSLLALFSTFWTPRTVAAALVQEALEEIGDEGEIGGESTSWRSETRA